MKYVFAVFDQATGYYGTPIFCLAQGEAVRSFMDEVNRKGSPLNAHPADYQLFSLASYDEVTGLFLSCDPKLVAKAADFFKEEDPF